MSRYLLPLVILVFTISACGDKLPTDIDANSLAQYDTIRSDNSFILDGAGYHRSVFNMTSESSSAFVSLQQSDQIMKVVAARTIHQPGHDPISTTILLNLPRIRGEARLENLFDKPRDSSIVWGVLHLGEKRYVSVEGKTDLIFANDLYNYVTGTYSGTFATAFGDTVHISEGRFDLPLESH